MRLLLTALAATLAVAAFHSTRPGGRLLKAASFATKEGVPAHAAYSEWRRKYGKLYASPVENDFRFTVFTDNLRYVQSSNEEQASYRLALNQFADLTKEEMHARYTGLRGPIPAMPVTQDQTPADELNKLRQTSRLLQQVEEHVDLASLPPSKDWHSEEALHDVPHQGSCGACYAFAAVASLEQLHFSKTGQLIKLSEQELVDCSKGQGNNGCIGGWMHQAFDYVLQFGGLQRARTYPYMAAEARFCKLDKKKNVNDLLYAYRRIPEGDNDRILRALVNGVVPASIDSRQIALYAGGVFDKKDCSTDIDHAVVIVGYGQTGSGQKYWKVRNSWGDKWGEEGYFRISRDEGFSLGKCGINKYSVYPLTR